MPVAPKSVRIQSSCQYLFTLLGSTGAKAALRTLMKLTPDPMVILSSMGLVISLNPLTQIKASFLYKFMRQNQNSING